MNKYFIHYKPKQSSDNSNSYECIVASDGTQYSSYIGKSAFQFEFSPKRLKIISDENASFVSVFDSEENLPTWFNKNHGKHQWTEIDKQTPSLKTIRQIVKYDI